ELIAAGSILTAGGVTVNNIARWNGSEWRPLAGGMDGPVYSLAPYSGRLIAGGAFTHAGAVAVGQIAAWTGTTWLPLTTGVPAAYFPGEVDSLVVSGSTLYVGGYCDKAGIVNAINVARWSGSSWSGFVGGSDDEVMALGVWNGNVIAGGYMLTV